MEGSLQVFTMKRYSPILAVLCAALLAGPVLASGQVAKPTTPPAATPGESQVKPPPAQPGTQTKPGTQKPPSASPAPITPAQGVPPPPGYVIGPEDVLQVLYWREKELSAEVTVRPDGMISLPLLNDVQAINLTPEQLRERVTETAKRYIEDPSVTVVIKEIKSRKVFITGQVAKPGPYPLTAPTTVLQLIATAGGLSEFAKGNDITILRLENGRSVSLPFKYKDVVKRKNLQQNIELRPGDTVIVP